MKFLDIVSITSELRHQEFGTGLNKFDYAIDVNGSTYHDIGVLNHNALFFEELDKPEGTPEIVFVHPFANYLQHLESYAELWGGNWVFPYYRLLKNQGYDVVLATDFVADTVNVAVITIADRLSVEQKASVIKQCKPVLCCAEVSPNVPDVDGVYFIKQNPTTRSSPRDMCFYLYQERLRPRNPSRGDRLRSIRYCGAVENLEPIFLEQRFSDFLKTRSIDFSIISAKHANRWGDYDDADLVLAVRPGVTKPWNNKPASKLINCWRAGVPLIAGHESSYVHYGNNGKDMVLVRSTEEVFEEIDRLTDPNEYRALSERVLDKQQEYSDSNMASEYYRQLMEITGH